LFLNDLIYLAKSAKQADIAFGFPGILSGAFPGFFTHEQ